jgi:hypothetical protein
MSLWQVIAGLAAPAKAMVEVFTPNAEREAERAHDERMAVSEQDLAALRQFAAEFHARERRTWWDALVDGLNRLPRPLLTLGVLGLFLLAPLDPVRFLALAKAYELMPDGFWALLSVIVAFYFGGRMQLTRQQMAVQGNALAIARDMVQLKRALTAVDGGPRPAASQAPPPQPAVVRNRMIAEWQRRGRPFAG